MSLAVLAAASLLSLALASPALAQAETPQEPAPEPLFPSPYDRDALAEEYRIAAGDVLQVFVWREPELSREIRVRPDGYMTVPLLGDVFVVAQTPTGLAKALSERFSRFISAANVTVSIGFSASWRFFVVGEVGKPGDFPLIGRTTILQALALAGGFKEFAKTDELKIIRQEVIAGDQGRVRTREIVIPVNYKSLAQGQNLRYNVVLKPGDVIVVP